MREKSDRDQGRSSGRATCTVWPASFALEAPGDDAGQVAQVVQLHVQPEHADSSLLMSNKFSTSGSGARSPG